MGLQTNSKMAVHPVALACFAVMITSALGSERGIAALTSLVLGSDQIVAEDGDRVLPTTALLLADDQIVAEDGDRVFPTTALLLADDQIVAEDGDFQIVAEDAEEPITEALIELAASSETDSGANLHGGLSAATDPNSGLSGEEDSGSAVVETDSGSGEEDGFDT